MSDAQLAHYRRRAAAVGFRPAVLRGVPPSELRAAAAHRTTSTSSAAWLIAGAVALGGGFLLGRWWARRRQHVTTVQGEYDVGLDALAVER